ncbi:EamA domain-containing membrane protein RarD [Acetitomaculum ruminis DSM 5522]|uniref:EamA domain-containing membrane protein RarD n=1 Tax=Acetitomaculum ruminis DSM 5522 TaxID=1120918 RepID=A0A1I0ZXU0_9FIRM|nr:DMT family transporter [Acetitomaculum ruminis]SFB30162.1 EamA domain-containing membrane protein RarD [Acetitomaculum ruminis DSM 5522]
MKNDFLKYIFSLLIFGSNGILASMIDITSYEIVFFRTFIGSVLLITAFIITKNKFTFFKEKQSFLMLIFSGISMGVSWIFLYEAYNQIGVSIATLCYYCGPVIVMVLSPFLFKEKFTLIKLLGFLTVIFGICLINLKAVNSGINFLGICFGMISALMYALMVIFNKKCQNIQGLENVIIQLFVSSLTAGIYTFFKKGISVNVSFESLVPLLILGIINTGFGCYLYYSSIGKLPVQTLSVCGYLEPLSAIVFSALILKEVLSLMQIAGGILIIAGAIISEGIISEKISQKPLLLRHSLKR